MFWTEWTTLISKNETGSFCLKNSQSPPMSRTNQRSCANRMYYVLFPKRENLTFVSAWSNWSLPMVFHSILSVISWGKYKSMSGSYARSRNDFSFPSSVFFNENLEEFYFGLINLFYLVDSFKMLSAKNFLLPSSQSEKRFWKRENLLNYKLGNYYLFSPQYIYIYIYSFWMWKNIRCTIGTLHKQIREEKDVVIAHYVNALCEAPKCSCRTSPPQENKMKMIQNRNCDHWIFSSGRKHKCSWVLHGWVVHNSVRERECNEVRTRKFRILVKWLRPTKILSSTRDISLDKRKTTSRAILGTLFLLSYNIRCMTTMFSFHFPPFYSLSIVYDYEVVFLFPFFFRYWKHSL